MATYKYQQNVFNGASYGYVKYNITPDLGTPIAPGETVTITGQAFSKEMAIKSIEFAIHSDIHNTYKYAYVNKSISKGATGTFTIEFTMWELNPQYWGAGRVLNLSFDFSFWSSTNAEGSGIGTGTNSAQKLTYLAYRLSVTTRNVQFERYARYGSEYRKDDEGSSVMGGFAVSLPEGFTASDITVASVHITNSGNDGVQTVTIPAAVISAALSENGYVETAPSLFASVVFDAAYNYTLSFTIGDAYNTISFSVLVARAFANVHMSGCPTGGVAFGKFSAATENHPLFECAFPALFYSGVEMGVAERCILPNGDTTPGATTFHKGFTNYSDGQKVKLHRTGNIVTLTGAAKRTSTLSSGGNANMFTVPEGYRPIWNVVQRMQGTSHNKWLLEINVAGSGGISSDQYEVNLSRYGGTSNAEISTSNWLVMTAVWITNDPFPVGDLL